MTKAMKIAGTGPHPIYKFNAEFERPLGFPNELILINAEGVVKKADLRDRCLANANGANLVGLNKPNAPVSTQKLRKSSCRHPAGCTPADDDDTARWN
jgi:hypothetical protein